MTEETKPKRRAVATVSVVRSVVLACFVCSYKWVSKSCDSVRKDVYCPICGTPRTWDAASEISTH